MTADPRTTENAATPLVLCATRRLARSLQLGSPAADGLAVSAFTIEDWLNRLFDEALLCGQLSGAEMAARVLTPLEDRLVWRQVIGRALGKEEASALFDLDGLAAAAQDAHALMITWTISAAAVQQGGSEESNRFLQWRHSYLRHCDSRGWRDAARHLDWQIERLAAGLAKLPPAIALAGFDRFNPAEKRLLSVLAERGIDVRDWPLGQRADGSFGAASFDDVEHEYRALADWLRCQLDANPEARLGVVVPDLAGQRARLTRILDQTIAPEAFLPAHAQRARRYNLSLGTALNGVPPIKVALSLLRLTTQARRVDQQELGALLLAAYWSADDGEADARALLDASSRKHLPAVLSLERWLQFADSKIAKGLPATQTVRQLHALIRVGAGRGGKKLPGIWATHFRKCLQTAGWPGERPLSSHDYQAREAFLGVLDQFAGFDAILGEQTVGEALALLNDACAEVLFQPRTEGSPPVQVLGLLEAAGGSFDALWVSGMLAAAWPPPARPNPLLPAALQRAVGAPNASPEVQLEFAGGIHQRFLQAAPEVIFSWPKMEGERVLQRSPLLEGLAPRRGLAAGVPALEQHRQQGVGAIEQLSDAMAPPVEDAGHLQGGTALLKAQAICPAAAFYQFRLGANLLETPVDGLDPRARGSLLHLVLENFWRGRGSAEIRAWTATEREAAIKIAVEAGLASFESGDGRADKTLPVRFRRIEAARLERLLDRWLALDLSRPEDFQVVGCEERHALSLDGIQATVIIDRIDELADGRRLVIDYKTGAKVDAKSWAATRITEPQLPIYAAFAVNPHPLGGAAFAQVRTDKLGFVGVTGSAGLLPKVKAFDEARQRYPELRFPDWDSLIAHWRDSLLAIASEIRSGDARVVFADPRDLARSPVLPLLRLAERRLQFEAVRAAGGEAS